MGLSLVMKQLYSQISCFDPLISRNKISVLVLIWKITEFINTIWWIYLSNHVYKSCHFEIDKYKVNFSKNINTCNLKNTLSAKLMNFCPLLMILKQYTKRKYLIETKKLLGDLCQKEHFVANQNQLSQLWLCLRTKTFPTTRVARTQNVWLFSTCIL